jgi:hypothetical protein
VAQHQQPPNKMRTSPTQRPHCSSTSSRIPVSPLYIVPRCASTQTTYKPDENLSNGKAIYIRAYIYISFIDPPPPASNGVNVPNPLPAFMSVPSTARVPSKSSAPSADPCQRFRPITALATTNCSKHNARVKQGSRSQSARYKTQQP